MRDTAQKIYDFMDTVEKLCYVRRDIFRSDGQKESDSDHITKLLFLLLGVLPYIKQPLDACRVLKMALIHDLVEAEVGDTPRLQSDHSADVKIKKKELEKQAIHKICASLPDLIGQEIQDLFAEYESKQTAEARIVKLFDKYEGDMQALKENKGLRFYQNGRYEFILNYLQEDFEKAKSDDEPFIAELQKIQLETVQQNVGELKSQGLLQ